MEAELSAITKELIERFKECETEEAQQALWSNLTDEERAAIFGDAERLSKAMKGFLDALYAALEPWQRYIIDRIHRWLESLPEDVRARLLDKNE